MPPPAVHAANGDGVGPGAGNKLAPRRLKFADDVSIGRLTVLDTPHKLFDRHLAGKPFADCRGTVVVPPVTALYLIANENVTSHYQCLSQMPPGTFVAAIFSRTTSGDELMAALNHLTGLQYLILDGTEISDAGLSKLSGLKNLEFVDLSHTDISGEGLIKLIEAGTLAKLEYLDLGSNQLSKRTIAALAKLPHLIRLRIAHAGLVDTDLKCIAAINGLRMLYLTDNAALTDKGLPALLASKQLQFIDLRGTASTARGMLGLGTLPINSLRLNEGACSATDRAKLCKTFKNLNLQLDQRAKAMPLKFLHRCTDREK